MTAAADRPPITVTGADGSELAVARDRVFVGNVSPGSVGMDFSRSLLDVQAFDRERGLGVFAGVLWATSGANICKSRNELVARFLGETDGDWLLFLDSDMVAPPSTILELLATAAITGARLVGGLCVMAGDTLGPIPTLYQLRDDAITGVQFDYPDDSLLQVAATGCACLMVHRTVLEGWRVKQAADRAWLADLEAEHGGGVIGEARARGLIDEPSLEFGWFRERVRLAGWPPVDGRPLSEHWVGEDIDFCLRMGVLGLGHDIYVNTGLDVGHAKHGRVWRAEDVRDSRHRSPAAVVAVIPMKDRHELTSALVDQLQGQGDAAEIVVVDNGSETAEAKAWLADVEAGGVSVLSMPGVGIHAMWNAGVERALERHGPRAHVALLNNDIEVGPEFLRRLSRALSDDRELVAVSGNYDGRTGDDPVERVVDICAGRYDGTGGLAGFGFMVRGEWFSTGWRFDEGLVWWCGDNDLVASIVWADAHRGMDQRGSKAGIVLGARMTHLDGGEQTAWSWSEGPLAAQCAADLERFRAKWAAIVANEEARAAVAAGDIRPVFEHVCGVESDIRDHLPRLRDLVVELDARRVVELGVRSGVSSVAWLAGLQETGGHLVAVDLAPVPELVASHPQCTAVQGNSEALHTLELVVEAFEYAEGAGEPGSVDVVFVDSDHRYEGTVAEIELWWPYVRPGGAMVFHDIAEEAFPHHREPQPAFPVRRAVDELVERTGAKHERSEECHGLSIVWKPEVS